MKTKLISAGIVCLILLSGCAQPKRKFGVEDAARYSREITLLTKFTVKSLCGNSFKSDLEQLKSYVLLSKEIVSFQQGDTEELFNQLDALITTIIKNQKTEDIARFVLIYVEKYVNSLDIHLTVKQEAVKTIVLAALEGAEKAIDELLGTFIAR